MKSFAACLLFATAFAADSEMFHSRSPIYGSYSNKAATVHKPYGYGSRSSYGHSSSSSYGQHKPSTYQKSHHYGHSHHQAPAKPQYPSGHGGYGHGYQNTKYTQKSPLDKLADEIAQNGKEIEMNKNAIAVLNSTQSKLVYDYFYVNDNTKITLNGENVSEQLAPGSFCAEAGETIKIFSNVSIDTNDTQAVTVLEIRKDGQRVAVSADAQGANGPSSLTVFYKETLMHDCTFDITIRVINDTMMPECIQVDTIQTGIEIWQNPSGVAVTEAPPSCAH